MQCYILPDVVVGASDMKIYFHLNAENILELNFFLKALPEGDEA